MEIEQFRVTVKTRDLERTRNFYGKTLALPELGTWEREGLRGVLFQAGAGQIEMVGRAPGASRRSDDETFEYRGPQQKMVLSLFVPSPEKAYEELIFRDRNLPGGLHQEEDGSTVFETRDPDGVKLVFRKPGT